MRILVLVLALILPGLAVNAQPIGIDFASMPRGTKVYYEDSKGKSWVEKYIGKRGKHYVFDVRGIPDVRGQRSKRYFNKAGLLVRIDNAKRDDKKFEPYHCGRVLGNCTMRSNVGTPTRLSGTQAIQLYQLGSYKVTRNGDAYRTIVDVRQFGLGDGAKPKIQTTRITINGKLGKYNLFQSRNWKSQGKTGWKRITKIEE